MTNGGENNRIIQGFFDTARSLIGITGRLFAPMAPFNRT
jgi:hypothetical protein